MEKSQCKLASAVLQKEEEASSRVNSTVVVEKKVPRAQPYVVSYVPPHTIL
jgi:hypothetical protein